MTRLLALLMLLSFPALAQTPAQNPSFNLVNRTSKPIREFFLSSTGRTNFGQNRLTTPIAPGATFAVRPAVTGNCIYDMRVVFADGSSEERRAVNTCTADDIVVGTVASAPAVKAANDPSFRLTNRGTEPVLELYATPAGKTRGTNLLADAALAPKSTRLIKLDSALGCSFDLRVVLGNKQAKERKATDLCKVNELPVP